MRGETRQEFPMKTQNTENLDDFRYHLPLRAPVATVRRWLENEPLPNSLFGLSACHLLFFYNICQIDGCNGVAVFAFVAGIP